MIDGEYKSTQEQRDLGMDKTIIHALLESDLPEDEKAHSRIWQEGQVVIGAGADTTAATIAITHFHILDNPSVLNRLRLEWVKYSNRRYECGGETDGYLDSLLPCPILHFLRSSQSLSDYHIL